MRLFFFGVFLVLLCFFLMEYRLVGQAVYGDGRYYWAFTRSLYFSQNIDISDEMGHYFSPESNNKASYFGTIPQLASKTKEVTHSFSLGIAVAWMPFFLLADALVVLLQAVGVAVLRNGYSDIYQIVVGIGNIGFVVAGLYLLSQVLLRRYKKSIVLLTLVLTVFATNLLYYSGLDVLNSHPFSFFLVTVLLFLIDYKKKNILTLFLEGVVIGLLASNRTQDSLFLFLPLAIFLLSLLRHDEKVIAILRHLVWFGLGVFLGYIPQLLLLSLGQGHFAFLPHTDQGFSSPAHILGILLDTKLGILWYMPVFLVGIVGLLFQAKKDTRIWLFLVLILLHFLLISSWDGWHQASYTMRYFISLLPLVSFGLAEVLKRLEKRFSLAFLLSLVGIFVLHQVVMILGFKLFLQDATNVGGELSRSGKMKAIIIHTLQQLVGKSL